MPADHSTRDGRLHGLSDTMRAFAEATIDYQRLLNTIADRLGARHQGAVFVRLQ